MSNNGNDLPRLKFGLGFEVTTVIPKDNKGWNESELDALASVAPVFRGVNEQSTIVALVGHWDLESVEERLGAERDVEIVNIKNVQSRHDSRLPFYLLEELGVKSLQTEFVFAR